MTTQNFVIRDDSLLPYTASIKVDEENVFNFLYQYIMNWSDVHYLNETEVNIGHGAYVFVYNEYHELPPVDLVELDIAFAGSMSRSEQYVIVPIRFVILFMHKMTEAGVDTYLDEYYHEANP